MPRGLRLPKERVYTGPANIWKRALSFIIDLVIIRVFLMYPFDKLLMSYVQTGGVMSTANFLESNPEALTTMYFTTFSIIIISLAYFVIFHYKLQQTPGKILLNLYVKSETKTLKFWQVLGRGMFVLSSLIIPYLVVLIIIDPIYLFFNPNNQRLSEKITKTITVEKFR